MPETADSLIMTTSAEVKHLRMSLFEERVKSHFEYAKEFLETGLKPSEDQLTAERVLAYQKHQLREFENRAEQHIVDRKLAFIQQVRDLRDEFETRLLNAVRSHLQAIGLVYDEFYEGRKTGIESIESERGVYLHSIVSSHVSSLKEVQKSQYELVTINLERIKRLKQYLTESLREYGEDRKKLLDMRSRYEAIQEPLRRVRAEIEKLLLRVKYFEETVLPDLTSEKKRQSSIRGEIKELDFQLEILIQKRQLLEKDVETKQKLLTKLELRQASVSAVSRLLSAGSTSVVSS